MSTRVDLNGILIPALPQNGVLGRSFRYGDGVFETMRLEGGGIPLIDYHVARLQRALAFIGITDGGRYSVAWLEERAAALAGAGATGRLRLTVTRMEGGKYGPTADVSRFVLEFEPMAFGGGWRGADWRVGLSKSLRMPTHPLANLKSTSALAYVQAARERRAAGWDEILLRNHRGRLSEGGYTNLFARIGGRWLTPPPGEGGVSGVLRARLLERGGGRVAEKPLTVSDAMAAQALVCTNALRGLHAVRRWENRQYPTQPVDELLAYLPATRKR